MPVLVHKYNLTFYMTTETVWRKENLVIHLYFYVIIF